MSPTLPTRPWERVCIDIFTFRQQDYLITVDYLSNFFEIDRLPSKRMCDVIYCLKGHFARYGLPMEVYSDNAFKNAEFSRFAQDYDFKHTTSSPHYAQSNGKAESAVKTAKRLMEKAAMDHVDPYLSLLSYRNTPTESLSGLSPSQILNGRRCRTHLPTTDALLSSGHAETAHEAQRAVTSRQAAYYDRGARLKQPLSVGDTVRSRCNPQEDWQKGQIQRVLPHRSYEVRFQDGSTLRRTSRHVSFSREPPIVIEDDTDPVPSAGGPLPSTIMESAPQDQSRTSLRNTVDATNQQAQTSATANVTRSGRHVKKPAKYNDYVCR